MAFGREEPESTNPFEDDTDESLRPNSAQPPSPFLPFVKIPIVIVCTVLVVTLLIAGTATTVISYPPRAGRSSQSALDGNYKILGPVLLTAGIFLLVVNVLLCVSVTREAYHVSRSIGPLDANTMRPMPVSLVSGPFYIATTDPMMAQPPYMPFHFPAPRWTHPNAPTSASPEEVKSSRQMRSSTATISRTRQPPFNPTSDDPTVIGA